MTSQHEAVRIENLDKKRTFQDTYGNYPYVCPPGQSLVVPWNAAKLWFGDPAKQDEPERGYFARKDELQRVFRRCGVDQTSPEDYVEQVRKNHPRVKVSTVDGEPISMILDDPEGKEVVTAAPTILEQEQLAGELDRLKKEQAKLLRMLEEQTSHKGLEDVPTDNPSKVPAS